MFSFCLLTFSLSLLMFIELWAEFSHPFSGGPRDVCVFLLGEEVLGWWWCSLMELGGQWRLWPVAGHFCAVVYIAVRTLKRENIPANPRPCPCLTLSWHPEEGVILLCPVLTVGWELLLQQGRWQAGDASRAVFWHICKSQFFPVVGQDGRTPPFTAHMTLLSGHSMCPHSHLTAPNPSATSRGCPLDRKSSPALHKLLQPFGAVGIEPNEAAAACPGNVSPGKQPPSPRRAFNPQCGIPQLTTVHCSKCCCWEEQRWELPT